jgi:ferrous iron transport protein B
MHEHDEILVALVGQPNSGKSTVFNFLTGLYQTVANYPGVTVTKKSGHYHEGNRRIEVVDLPGTYSLTSYSQEERVTRDFLLLERPEVVVAVLDASNLRRHLYFLFQLLELRIPVAVCLNMTDIAHRRGMNISVEKLREVLNCPVIAANARKGEGLEELRKTISEVSSLHAHEPSRWKIDYGQLEPVLNEIETLLSEKVPLIQDFDSRWLAVKLLENDREARRIVQHHIHEKDWEPLLEPCLNHIRQYEAETGSSARKTIAAVRNALAEKIEKDIASRPLLPKRNTDTLDLFLCHPVLGIVFVALIMLAVFELAFNISDGWDWLPFWNGEGRLEFTTPVAVFENIFDVQLPALFDFLFHIPDGDFHSLVYDGIITGVGGVLVFVPVIFFIFLFISALEQSGYMARVVVVLDRIMRFFGLHGQSVLPMVIAGGIIGGCAVPAIMATRTMREPRERLLTIMVIPLMNCGAKVPVYVLLIAAFFSAYQGLVMASLIFISWGIALAAAFLLGKTFVKGTAAPLVLELPTYQIPRLKDIFRTAFLQSWWFVKRAGTIILAVNVILWALMYYPKPANPDASQTERLQGSYAAGIGHFFEPVSRFAGLDWRDNVALLGGFAAKEVIVSSLETLYGIEDKAEEKTASNTGTDNTEEKNVDKLATSLKSNKNWSPLKAFAVLIFVMIYAPCAATCAVIRQETGTWKYMLITMLYTTVLAMILAVAVYQFGTLLGMR